MFGNTVGTLAITGQPNNVEEGGQFNAVVTVGPTITDTYVYCVDDLNYVSVPNPAYAVNITDLANSTDVYNDTRYGQTPASSFSTNTVTVPNAIGTAQDRYEMAAWLILQYSFVSGNGSANNDEIQNAIWTLMDATGAVYSSNGGIGSYITQAEAWFTAETPTALAAFENDVVIYSDTNIASETDPTRYTGTKQEMIGFVPEPDTLALLGVGLVAIGLFRKRIKA